MPYIFPPEKHPALRLPGTTGLGLRPSLACSVGGSRMNISVLGVDIAKNIFQLHGVDISGKRVLKQRIEREKLSSYIANLPL